MCSLDALIRIRRENIYYTKTWPHIEQQWLTGADPTLTLGGFFQLSLSEEETCVLPCSIPASYSGFVSGDRCIGNYISNTTIPSGTCCVLLIAERGVTVTWCAYMELSVYTLLQYPWLLNLILLTLCNHRFMWFDKEHALSDMCVCDMWHGSVCSLFNRRWTDSMKLKFWMKH